MSRIAAVQMNSGDDVQTNLELAGELIVEACARGASFVVLPECFALMAKDPSQRLDNAEPAFSRGPIQTFLSEVAAQQKIWIMAAGVFVSGEEAGMVRNATFVFDDRGGCVSRYDKYHLFNMNLSQGEHYSESSYTEPGRELVCHDTPVGRCGVSVCYDIRFPWMYSELALQGAAWFAVPSAFAYTTGKAHWEVLLRARAIENHAYVVAAAQWGTHPGGRRTFGNTMIVDPWGEIVAHQVDGNGVVFADIYLDEVRSVRSRFDKAKF